MLNLLELEKIIAKDEDYIIHIKVKKDMKWEFMMVFNSLVKVTERLSTETRKAMYKERIQKEAEDKIKQNEKGAIKKKYKEEFMQILITLKSFKGALKQLRINNFDDRWLIAELAEELRLERDLKILKLDAQGLKSYDIEPILHVSSGHIRKVIANNKIAL